MTSAIEHPIGSYDDNLARQLRQRDARLLDQPLSDHPALTLADVVADVLAASDEGRDPLDVHRYLAAAGHSRQTIEAVLGYLRRQVPPLLVGSSVGAVVVISVPPVR